MKLKPIGSNMTELEIGPYTVLFSYETPVAYCEHDLGFFRTDQFYSVTTSKHINKWLDGRKAETIPQSQIDEILSFRRKRRLFLVR